MLVHCALGINRSAAVCVAYMMVDRRMPLLAATRLIKDRRRIVLANKSFQRQLVGFARGRGLLGDLRADDVAKDDEYGRLFGAVRRMTLHDRASNGPDWKVNGLRADLSNTGRSSDASASSYRTRSGGDDWSWSRADDVSPPHDGRTSRYDYLRNAGDFSPRRMFSRDTTAARSRETDDLLSSSYDYVSPRQYRASKSATSLVPASGARHARAPAAAAVHSRSRSTSRFSLGFL